jgi:aspartate racemase
MYTKLRLGIIGGMGSQAGAHFFKKLIDYSPAVADQDFIEILMHSNSAVPDRTTAIMNKGPSPVGEIMRSIRILEPSVDIIVIPCVTSYYFYDEISCGTTVPVLNPISILRDHIISCFPDTRRAGLLATTGSISGKIFHKAFEGDRLQFITLDAGDQEEYFMQSVYMENGLKSATRSKRAEDLFNTALAKLLSKNVDLLIAGCSEIPIVFPQRFADVPHVDVMDLMAKEVVRRCYNRVE